jgi:hypothetical protein
VSWKSRSHASNASQRSSIGVRFQRSQRVHTTQRRPFSGSKASLRPTGKLSRTALAPKGRLQNMQSENTRARILWLQILACSRGCLALGLFANVWRKFVKPMS